MVRNKIQFHLYEIKNKINSPRHPRGLTRTSLERGEPTITHFLKPWEEKSDISVTELNIFLWISHVGSSLGAKIPLVSSCFAPPLLLKETHLLRYTWPVKLGAIDLFLEAVSTRSFCGCCNLLE